MLSRLPRNSAVLTWLLGNQTQVLVLAQEAFYSRSHFPNLSAGVLKVTGVSLKPEWTISLKSLEAGRSGTVGSRTYVDVLVAQCLFILHFHLPLLCGFRWMLTSSVPSTISVGGDQD